MKSALICGISGQDGAYLAQLLLLKGYRVYGTSRDVELGNWSALKELGIYEKVELLSLSPIDFKSVLDAFYKSKPDEVYFLAGQSSVALSFDQPVDTMQSIVLGTLNMLEACRLFPGVKLYNAGSSECFGDTNEGRADETTNFNPQSPYAIGKSASFWLVSNYRKAYGIFACTGILFNHESPFRPTRFVTKKIVQAARDIAQGSNEKLVLGNLNITRDWGWAPEYVEAMWLMLQHAEPDDFVIATGHSSTLEDFVSLVFQNFGLDWEDHVIQDPKYFRPIEHLVSKSNPEKAKRILGWEAKNRLKEVVKLLCK
ncbi:GDP-mannose 4,6-dehydratase [Aquirufa ecclesiirivi]|uniref:GDP-mannose 4,6-dehydratase n=1 Tax=Aquirufa ecclesiirivi TaxID=2715124 RepID=UPI001408D48F|nr:GDP-mannose 4,6-dehydratase [Aquirufa ecclesiirivi]NHC48155.1 GDP-mannose 4,6-dehydratase [Aquirufa ecclesiirivi]